MSFRIAVLGASRGLGLHVVKNLASLEGVSGLFLSSRKTPLLEKVRNELSANDQFKIEVVPADFTDSNSQSLLLAKLKAWGVTHILYIAGGGPYGAFERKDWKDHAWALELNLLFPARLLHFAMSELKELQQVIFVGSSVAESKADPNASSYAAAKHGLKGLITSVKAEKPELDVRLYSPGYMDTDLLPQNARVRHAGDKLSSPEDVAKDLVTFMFMSGEPFHRVRP